MNWMPEGTVFFKALFLSCVIFQIADCHLIYQNQCFTWFVFCSEILSSSFMLWRETEFGEGSKMQNVTSEEVQETGVSVSASHEDEKRTEAIRSVVSAFVDIAFEVSAPQYSNRAANQNCSLRKLAQSFQKDAA